MTDVDKSSETQRAITLLILGGAFHIFIGLQSYLLLSIVPPPLGLLFGPLMTVIGLLSICAGLAVHLQKSWTTIMIVGICVASCTSLILFGYYLLIVIVVPVYWIAIKKV